ncbi:MAG: molecular chaperone DnaK [Pirellulaceae bacterium]|jgi:molecular chaperone DnaK
MSNQSDGVIVGIDLGTTNSVVAAIVDGQPKVLAEDGELMLPSIVGVNSDNKLVIGVLARNQLAAFPSRTVASVKRKMGKMIPITLGEQSFTPPEVSAMILRRLRDRAAKALGQPVHRAVITVPAFFDENQRQATREAGELAGLSVERIINEPTAATLVYHVGTEEQRHIIVYDFGGGTFDVSIVRMEQGVVEVLSSKGDTQLGGDDIDAVLMQHLAEQFIEEHQIDLRSDPSTRYRLLQACEAAKRELSTSESADIAEEFIADKDGLPLNLVASVTRHQFEELIAPLVDRTIESVDAALRESGLTIHQIDDLVLVGGSTRIPLVQNRLREEFGREPSRAVDPDMAVALGAATQAAMLDGLSIGPVLVDVTGHTLGVEVLEEGMPPRLVFSPIIRRNSPLPAQFEQSYWTVRDDQKAVEIQVLQGEHSDPSRNCSIGKFILDIEAGGGGNSKINVRFKLSLDGTLIVTATQPATGLTEELSVDNALSHFQSEERERVGKRLSAMFGSSDELLDDSDALAERTWSSEGNELAMDGDSTAPMEPSEYTAAISLLEQAETVVLGRTGEDADDIKTAIRDLKKAIQKNDKDLVSMLSEELDDILFYVQ